MIAENIKMYNTKNKYGLLTSVKGLIKSIWEGISFLKIFSSKELTENTHTTHVLPEAMDPCWKGYTSCVGFALTAGVQTVGQESYKVYDC